MGDGSIESNAEEADVTLSRIDELIKKNEAKMKSLGRFANADIQVHELLELLKAVREKVWF
jgi:hypothetical protein